MVEARRGVVTFAGQGSQYGGMGKAIYDAGYPEAREAFHIANDVLGPLDVSPGVKRYLTELCFDTSAEGSARLTETRFAQVAIFTTNEAYRRVRSARGKVDKNLKIDIALGHSVSIYNALVDADAMTFEGALPVVQTRGEEMGEACSRYPGSMRAVTLVVSPENEFLLREIIEPHGVDISAINTLNQYVVGGLHEGLSDVGRILDELNIKNGRLRVGGPFHTRYMREAQERVRQALAGADIRQTRLSTVIANSSPRLVETPEEVREEGVRHITEPVRWAEGVAEAEKLGGKIFIEAGTKTILTAMQPNILGEGASEEIKTNEEKVEDRQRIGTIWRLADAA